MSPKTGSRTINRFLLVTLATVCLAPVGRTQETTGGIRARLLDAGQAPLAGAEAIATSPDLLGSRRAVAGPDGVLLLLALPPGHYTLTVRSIGHRPLIISEINVQLGRISGLGSFALEATVIALEALTITAPPITLDPVGTTVGGILEAGDLALLPSERDYKSLMSMLAHANTSYHGDPVNVAGSTGLENAYFLDGVNVTSLLNGRTGISLPYNFIRTVEVRAGGYGAQHGRAVGGIVNAVTYTGSNDLEASVFGYLTHSALAATPRMQSSLRDVNSVGYDFGVRLSGPLARDRLWFSAAYNPRIERADRSITGLGDHQVRHDTHIFAGKLTFQPDARSTMELSVFGDPSSHQTVEPDPIAVGPTPVNADPYLHRLEQGATTVSLRASRSFGTSLTLEAAASRTSGRDHLLPATARGSAEPLYIDPIVTGTVEGGAGLVSRTAETRSAAMVRGTLAVGRHHLVAGLEYEDNRVARTIAWSGDILIFRVDTSSYVTDYSFSDGAFHNRIPTAYLQDSWRLADRLTVNAGLRWSQQTLTGASGRVAQRLAAEPQPRLGFNWQLDEGGRHAVRGSYGRFYHQVPLNLSTQWYVDYLFVVGYYSSDPRQPGATPDSLQQLTTLETDITAPTGISAENYDEFTVAYERLVGTATSVTARLMHRGLRSSFQFGEGGVIGTPGRGNFDFLPAPRREYTALELSAVGAWRGVRYQVSYVLSRAWGNYTGLFTSDLGITNPGGNIAFIARHQALNSTGLLPNDRTHVLKVVTSSRPARALSVGSFITLQSGTPLNEFGAGPFGPLAPSFLVQRGSAGRSPVIWDLNVRLAYESPLRGVAGARIVLDLLHLGNPRTAVRHDERHYLSLDAMGNQAAPNPNYLRPTAFQPPMTARLGFEAAF